MYVGRPPLWVFSRVLHQLARFLWSLPLQESRIRVKSTIACVICYHKMLERRAMKPFPWPSSHRPPDKMRLSSLSEGEGGGGRGTGNNIERVQAWTYSYKRSQTECVFVFMSTFAVLGWCIFFRCSGLGGHAGADLFG
jgi:hypothetical protein